MCRLSCQLIFHPNMSDTHAIFKVTPGLQSYEWGKKGSASLAAQLAEECVEGFEVDEEKAYAEVSLQRRLMNRC
jgi:hypothetical protein